MQVVCNQDRSSFCDWHMHMDAGTATAACEGVQAPTLSPFRPMTRSMAENLGDFAASSATRSRAAVHTDKL